MLWEVRNLIVPQAKRRPHVLHESAPQVVHGSRMYRGVKIILHGPRSVWVRHRLTTARRATPVVFVGSQQLALRSGKGFLFLNAAPLVVLQHSKGLSVWSAVEVSLAFGLHDFVVADDASVRRAGTVHRPGRGGLCWRLARPCKPKVWSSY